MRIEQFFKKNADNQLELPFGEKDMEKVILPHHILADRNGRNLVEGDFIEYEGDADGEIAPGPYRYEGYRHWRHIFSLPGMDISSLKFKSEAVTFIPWKRWRNPKLRREEVLSFMNVKEKKSGAFFCSF